jgi:hypothetical protein
LNLIIIFVAFAVGGYLAFSRRLAASSGWKATVTPLASIMGSGFLISAPLLGGIVGNFAVVFMGLLLVLAYMVGSAIRFNIRYFEPIENKTHGPAQDLGFLSRIVLIGAYFISVTFYLELLAAFLLRLIGIHDQTVANGITTFLLLTIGSVGMWRGLKELEVIERYAVAFNLGMIGALLTSLVIYNSKMILDETWTLPPVSSDIDLHDVRVLLGLLIVVQGFETSRYLGDVHPARQRITTMRIAQIVSSVIYLLFIGLATILLRSNYGADVTAVIDMTKPVAVVLPILIAVAAVGSQFSAAVADNEGAGGLIEEITQHKVRIRYAYLSILLVTVVLTWSSNINEIIAYASRAFALYYSLQCAVAWVVARQEKQLPYRRMHLVLYAFLTMICLLVFALGIPSG